MLVLHVCGSNIPWYAFLITHHIYILYHIWETPSFDQVESTSYLVWNPGVYAVGEMESTSSLARDYSTTVYET